MGVTRWTIEGEWGSSHHVLDGRWEIRPGDDGWWVCDRDLGRAHPRVGLYATLDAARASAERRATRARSEAVS